MAMKRIYFFPKIDYREAPSPNPYAMQLERALGEGFRIVNQRNTRFGILDAYLYFGKTDLFVFNWIEDMPVYFRFGKVQVFFFVAFLFLCRVFHKKILWVLHNKYSHSIVKNSWTDLMFRLLMAHADLILTHSAEGVAFGKEKYPKHSHKIRYLIHPVNPPFQVNGGDEKTIDLLLWGSIAPYKGIVPFLEYVKHTPEASGIRIRIAGSCVYPEYARQIRALLSGQIVFDETLYPLEQIAAMARHSRFILFTHLSSSVLSSGALMDSIRMGIPIIGPDIGAFRDLKATGLVRTYQHYEDVIHYCRNYTEADRPGPEIVGQFCLENSWSAFGVRLRSELNGLFAEKAAGQQPVLTSHVRN